MAQTHEQEALAKLIAGKRLEMQAQYSALLLSGHHIHVHMEEFPAIAWLLKTTLKATGLWPVAVRNSTSYRIVEHIVPLPHLPGSFDGFRILHLSDLHIEGMVDKGQALQTTLRTLHYDLCVLTGDFRFLTYGSYDKTLRLMETLVKTLHAPFGVTGILGNHDWLEMVPGLEQGGIHMLLNETQSLEKGSDAIWLLGLDDVHYYETGDLKKAVDAAPSDAVRILLVQKPTQLAWTSTFAVIPTEVKSAFLEGAPLLPIVAAPEHIKQGHGNMKPCAATPHEASAPHCFPSGYSANRKSSSTLSVKAKFSLNKIEPANRGQTRIKYPFE
jgi:hypothetical protein